MPRARLTRLAVERLPIPEKDTITVWDERLPGFGVRVSAKGRRTWVAMYRVSGKAVMETLGTYPTMELDEAREKARRSINQAREGVNSHAERRQAEQAEQAPTFTFSDLVQQYDRFHLTSIRATSRVEMLRRLKAPMAAWQGRGADSIKKPDINRLLDGIAERGARSEAAQVLGALKTLYRWGIAHAHDENGEDRLERNPTDGIAAPARRPARDRVLSEDEISAFWRACERLGWPYGELFKLLLLTGCRENEIAGMRWSELDLDRATFTLPSERAKNHRQHTIALSAPALAILRDLPRFTHDLVFSMKSERPVTGFTQAKARLDALMGAIFNPRPLQPWVLHDLRRTCATGMAEVQIQPHIIEECLNHITARTPIAAIYNRHRYLIETAEAWKKWGHKVMEIVGTPGPGQVVPLRRA